jgi:hypothetical protein
LFIISESSRMLTVAQIRNGIQNSLWEIKEREDNLWIKQISNWFRKWRSCNIAISGEGGFHNFRW